VVPHKQGNPLTRQPINSLTKIGIMGGTFDPIHYGHLILAEQAWEQLGLENVVFITAADPPHKASEAVSEAGLRHEMVRLAVINNEHFECSTIEIDRPGPSYSIDTLRQIIGLYGEETCVYLLLGADEAAGFMTWRDPYAIQELATVVVANRPGLSVARALDALPADFAKNVTPLSMPGVDVSSTDIRERVRRGGSIKYLVPEAVESFIIEKGLYRG
ncbi:MAG: nicotinate-nucleotide adenylyltransferase, partial [Chloroflexi bacterium]|nr:nicotinate-nucleotide adenylyltransferase [Chloroflexota bacterium]